jgi:hypothetical protein
VQRAILGLEHSSFHGIVHPQPAKTQDFLYPAVFMRILNVSNLSRKPEVSEPGHYIGQKFPKKNVNAS